MGLQYVARYAGCVAMVCARSPGWHHGATVCRPLRGLCGDGVRVNPRLAPRGKFISPAAQARGCARRDDSKRKVFRQGPEQFQRT